MEWPQFRLRRAASSAKVAGYLYRSTSHRCLDDHTRAVLEERYGAVAEEFAPDRPFITIAARTPTHLTELLMAAFEATGINVSPHGAEPIANLIIGGHAAANRWRVPEHSTNKWLVARTAGSPVLRPYGTTSAHSLERSHLLLQSWELGGRKLDWLPNLRRRFSPTGHFSEKLTSTALCRLVSFQTLPPTGSVTRGLLERIKHT